MVNRYPLWRYILIAIIVILGVIYSLPNLYGDDPGLQIQGKGTTRVDLAVEKTVKVALKSAQLSPTMIRLDKNSLRVHFSNTDTQIKAKGIVQQALGNQYVVALALMPRTPSWLLGIGAHPMKYGLDLRGGIHFLMQVGVDSVLKTRVAGELKSIGDVLREKMIRYTGLARKSSSEIVIRFSNQAQLNKANSVLNSRFSDYLWTANTSAGNLSLVGRLQPKVLAQVRKNVIQQAMMKLTRRVDELGVSNAVVQQQGQDRIIVDLPGIQDSAQAKNLLGKTATLEFHLVSNKYDPNNLPGGVAPVGTTLYQTPNGPVLLKNRIILKGSSITGAVSSYDQNGRPSVNIRLGGSGESEFEAVTAANVGKRMAVVYVDTVSKIKTVDGKKVISYHNNRRVINVATIISALGNSFQVTGLSSPQEAQNLALLLRAGALPAPITPISENVVGPSLGVHNIKLGMYSIEIGFAAIVIFMAMYYGVFGVIADISLMVNLILLAAILSFLQMTLTLPGMAGVLLTLGMAVDANVLIYERIREELRRGNSIQSSIFMGFDRAFTTIVDANVTTLLVAVVLFWIGGASGAVKGFAVTLTVGLLVSMFSAVTVTRAMVNLIYGRKGIKKLSIGLRWKTLPNPKTITKKSPVEEA